MKLPMVEQKYCVITYHNVLLFFLEINRVAWGTDPSSTANSCLLYEEQRNKICFENKLRWLHVKLPQAAGWLHYADGRWPSSFSQGKSDTGWKQNRQEVEKHSKNIFIELKCKDYIKDNLYKNIQKYLKSLWSME